MNTSSEYNWIINMKNVEYVNITDDVSLYGRMYVTMSAVLELIYNIKKIWFL